MQDAQNRAKSHPIRILDARYPLVEGDSKEGEGGMEEASWRKRPTDIGHMQERIIIEGGIKGGMDRSCQ